MQAPAVKQLLQMKDEIIYKVIHPNAQSTFITEPSQHNQFVSGPTDIKGEIQEWVKLTDKYADALDALCMKCAYCG